jgi:putative ABC transport system substrate-binding protein
MLTPSFTAFDPERLFATVNCCIAKGSFALDPEGTGRGRFPVVAGSLKCAKLRPQAGEAILRRRDFIAILGGAAAWPLAARAQRQALPVIGFVSGRSAEVSAPHGAAFRKGLNEAGMIEDQNVTVEYRWLDGKYDRLPMLMADLVGRPVAVIATAGAPAALAAKAATTSVPVVFGVAEDPVKLGLVSSLARPAGNTTGINFFNQETGAKQLGLLHDLVPRAMRIAMLVNPANPTNAESALHDIAEAARTLGLQVQVHKASTAREIEAAFATLVSERADALFVAPDGFFDSRRVEFATLAIRNAIPTAFAGRDQVVAGGLMSYGTDILDTYRQIGAYVGRILKGTKPADLPVIQATKFEFVINLQTARALGLEVPAGLLTAADEVIE